MKASNIKIYSVLMVVAIITIAGAIFFNYLTNKKSNNTSNLTKTTLGSYQENAKKIISWLDKEKNSSGVYSTGCYCVDEECNQCRDKAYAPRAGILPLWGKYKFVEKTKSFDIDLSKDVEAILNSELQFDSYNCKFMFELWQGEVLNEEDKEKIKDICRNGGYEAMSKGYYEDLTVEELDKQIMIKIARIVTGGVFAISNDYETEELKSFYRKAVTYVSEYTTRDKWEPLINDERSERLSDVFKLAARKNFAIALDGYTEVDKDIYNNSLLGIACADMYKMTNDHKYLSLAEYLYENNNNLISEENSYDKVYFALFSKEIFEATLNNTYQQKMKDLVKEVLNISFDFKNKNAIKGDHNHFGVPENGLMVGLLSL